MSGGLFWGAWVCMIAMAAVIANLDDMTEAWPNLPLLITVLSASLPVFTIFMFANLLAEETEGRLLPHLYTLPGSLLRLIAERILLVMIFQSIVWIGLLAASVFVLKPLAFRDMVYITSLVVPANLLLGLLTLLAVLLGKNTIAGLIPGFVYWFADLVFPGWGGPLRLIWRGLLGDAVYMTKHSLVVLGLAIIAFLLLCYTVIRGKAWIVRK
jgi:hypothetical protein